MPPNFYCCFVFLFSRNNACKNAGFSEPVLVANALFADSIVWKNKLKLRLEKAPPGKKPRVFLPTLFVKNERETSKLKIGGMFFYEMEGHMYKLDEEKIAA